MRKILYSVLAVVVVALGVFAFKNNEKSGVSVGVRGPVSIHQAVSIDPVEVLSMQITTHPREGTETHIV